MWIVLRAHIFVIAGLFEIQTLVLAMILFRGLPARSRFGEGRLRRKPLLRQFHFQMSRDKSVIQRKHSIGIDPPSADSG